MIHNVLNLCLFVVVIIVVYSSYSFAPAQPLWNSATQFPPDPNVVRTCSGWLHYEGLTENDVNGYESNKYRAAARSKQFDHTKHVWAACYAFFISSFPVIRTHSMSVDAYCEKINATLSVTTYVSLQDAEMTCNDWINVNGYFLDNKLLNIWMSMYRIPRNDLDAHFLVPLYSHYLDNSMKEVIRLHPNQFPYITDWVTDIKEPLGFCVFLENNVGDDLMKIPYATLETKLYCKEWIVLNGYSDNNVSYNMRKARTQQDELKPYLSKWTVEYINYLLQRDPNEESATPEEYCFFTGYLETYYYNINFNNAINSIGNDE